MINDDESWLTSPIFLRLVDGYYGRLIQRLLPGYLH